MFNNSTNNFIFNLVKQKLLYFITSLTISLVGMFLSILGIVSLISIILTAIVDRNLLTLSSFTPFLRSVFIWGYHLNQNYPLIVLLSLIALIFILEKVAIYFNSIFNLKYSKYLIYEMKCKGLLQLSEIDFSYYTQNKTGDILFKINREIDKAALAIASIQQIVILSITSLILVAILIVISLPLSLITLSFTGLIITVDLIYRKATKQRELNSNQKTQIYNRQLIDFLLGIRQIKNLATEKIEYQKLTKSINLKHQAELESQKNSIVIYLINNIAPIAIALVLTIGSYYLYGKEVGAFIPVAIIYFACLLKIFLPITRLKNARTRFMANQSGLEVFVKFLQETNRAKIESGSLTLKNLQNKIEFHNVTFAYPNHARIILDKIDLVIPAQKTTALIGSSGAGKKTLVNLLSRIYEPIEGKIMLDCQDIKQYDLSSLRKSIVAIAPEPFIFNNSIFYNLTYGLENITEERAIEVTKITKAYDFIIRLPQGFDTIVGRSKTVLSEAQKQLLIITRALLLQPQIIIVDRPFQDLDRSEYPIVESALEKLCRDRTTIIIGDRLPNRQQPDKIIILNKGKIVESGTHQELLRTSNLYQRMCSAQLKTSQQSQQQHLAKKISKKLARQNNNNLSYKIRNNLNSLLNYLRLINDGLIEDDLEESRILDESYQSAKNMLASLREYERKISQGLKKDN